MKFEYHHFLCLYSLGSYYGTQYLKTLTDTSPKHVKLFKKLKKLINFYYLNLHVDRSR